MTVVEARVEALTNDRLLRRNVVINLAAWALPAIAALVSLPLLARGLGAARFGLVALTWSAVGIFSMFDFGLGRALTRLVAERLTHGREEEVPALAWSAGWILLGLTSILAVIGVVVAPAIVDLVLHVPPSLRSEAIGVVRLLSISIPPLTHGVALRGILEAGQRFTLANQLRVPLGIISYAGPLLALPLGADARVAVGIIVAGRVFYWLAHFPVLAGWMTGLGKPQLGSRAAVRELAHIGGWITISNVISPIIVQADRVAIAALLPIAASGWYGTAAEVATKQWLFTAALGPVLFSALSAAIKTAPERAAELMERASKITLIVLLPAAMLLTGFAEPALRWWMREAYTPEAAHTLRWLTIAVYVNSVCQVPYHALQGGVDARAPALIHMIELPIYLGLMWYCTVHWGVVGAALVWLGRMTIDGIAMWIVAHRLFPVARPAIVRVAALATPCVATLLCAAWLGARNA